MFALVIVSVAVIAFFVQSSMNRKISFSSAGQARANMLALNALNTIKWDFTAEMATGSLVLSDTNTGSTVVIYSPSSNYNMVPYRMTSKLSQPLDPSIPANLIKWSSGSFALWQSGSATFSQSGPVRAYSGNSTKNPAIGGRYINTSRWVKPAFGTSGTFPTSVVPEWVLMTRQGPLASGTSALSMLGSGSSSLANSSANNPNYVIGRYAYTVYDEGGLLDIAAAGYSSANSSNDVAPKGNQGYADLTQLGLTSSQMDQLVTWRNAATAATGTSYVNYLSGTAAQYGFLQAAPGDNAFVSRQDFLQFWNTQIVPSGSAAANLTPYFTTFSREMNAPGWGPEHNAADPSLPGIWSGTNTSYDPVAQNATGVSYAYNDNANSAYSSTLQNYNRFLPNVRVTTAFTRLSMSGTVHEQAVVGEPLVKNRFDLSKLAWITPSGTLPSGVSATDVYNYFGLTYVTTGTNFTSAWVYNHTSTTPPGQSVVQTNQILPLDQVASAGREPDFFELLQATILQGSLGLCSGDYTQAFPTAAQDAGTNGGEFYRLGNFLGGASVTNAPIGAWMQKAFLCRWDQNASGTGTSAKLSLVYAQPKYQVIQIGANIIDQARADNFPTDFMLNNQHFYGTKNLPYLSATGLSILRASPNAGLPSAFPTTCAAYVHQWLTFALWNPHQNAAASTTAAMASAPTGPRYVRVCVTNGQEYPELGVPPNYLWYNGNNAATTPGVDYSGRVFMPAGTVPTAGPYTGVISGTTQGPAWIKVDLTDSFYNNFADPTAIDYNHSSTTDSVDLYNINNPCGRIGSGSPFTYARAGIYLGWSFSPDNYTYKVPLCAPLYKPTTSQAQPAAGQYEMTVNLITPYRVELQYLDPSTSGTWHTYQRWENLDGFYQSAKNANDPFLEQNDPQWSMVTTSTASPNNYVRPASPQPNAYEYFSNLCFDPRTPRHNIAELHSENGSLYPLNTLLTPPGGTISVDVLPGGEVGVHFPNSGSAPNGRNVKEFWMYWFDNYLTTSSQNYYTDRDFLKRVGDGGGWTTANPTFYPMVTGQTLGRPLFLGRPFRSIGELGYVFRDDPWKTLNLMSANSGDTGLLDLFYVGSGSSSTPTLPAPDIIDGRMNINSAAMTAIAASGTNALSSPVFQALLSQSARTYTTTGTAYSVSGTMAQSDTQALTSGTNGVVAYIKSNGPLTNISDLSSVYPQNLLTPTENPGIKQQREAFTRALADSSGTRTWNLMIDIIAQSGKYNSSAGSLDQFTVEGEKHYWLHVAIDRFTGKVVDQQLEPVVE
ncbi:MAG: hypothetical protein WCD79_12355 [Chthoniobacteraceae bacterium]